MLLIVRDPLDRFLSAFVDKCILDTLGRNIRDNCYGCGKDVACVLKRLYERASSYADNPANSLVVHDDHHFFPQNWHCSMEKYRWNYHVLKYWSDPDRRRKTMNELNEILLKAKVPASDVATISAQTEAYTNHSTVHSSDRIFYRDIIVSNARLLQLLRSIYFHDYEIFGYSSSYADAKSEF
uniref:Sulfotransfer_1 domain-containing protein n=1 Tax=Steinernema glaseri TaxID=37863 RepID=A0A1I8AGH8_9BILA